MGVLRSALCGEEGRGTLHSHYIVFFLFGATACGTLCANSGHWKLREEPDQTCSAIKKRQSISLKLTPLLRSLSPISPLAHTFSTDVSKEASYARKACGFKKRGKKRLASSSFHAESFLFPFFFPNRNYRNLVFLWVLLTVCGRFHTPTLFIITYSRCHWNSLWCCPRHQSEKWRII